MIGFDRFPGGVKGAVTFSYDDGQVFDRRLVELLDSYGLKGTFNLNSGRFGHVKGEDFVTPEEIPSLYAHHEVACHGVNHPFLDRISPADRVGQVLRDREALERIVGRPVIGMAYPYGSYDQNVLDTLKQCGVRYCRTARDTGGFDLPKSFLEWHPTCHHNAALEMTGKFFSRLETPYSTAGLFYVWGHSFVFERNHNWELIEKFCREISGRENVWYATNGEIFDYLTAQRRLEVSVDGAILRNPSAVDVWVTKDREPVKIPAGQTVRV